MNESVNPDTNMKRRQRLVEQADKMVRSGRLTDQEAERLRSADEPAEVDSVIRTIRVRHAGTRLDAAIADGSLTREEADGFLARLRNGEHSRALRAQLRRLRPGNRADGVAPRQDDPQEDPPST